jgi:hypothetical protein
MIGSCAPGGRAVVTLVRPGPGHPRKAAQDWLLALQWGVACYGTSIRMICLATPDAARELGPLAAK